MRPTLERFSRVGRFLFLVGRDKMELRDRIFTARLTARQASRLGELAAAARVSRSRVVGLLIDAALRIEPPKLEFQMTERGKK